MATVEIPVDVSYEAAAQDGPKFVGMGKEELLRKANEPFWVYLRWALFILFWGAWLGMLAGAVVIILNAPKSETDCVSSQHKKYFLSLGLIFC